MAEVSNAQTFLNKKTNGLMPAILHVLEEKLAVVANNLANTGAGFKSAMLREKEHVIRGIDGQKISIPIVDDVIYNFSQGGLKHTHEMTHFAIMGSGFFKIKAPFGTAYSRNGQFILSSSGALSTIEGYSVLSENDDEIKIPPTTKRITIDEKGTLYADGESIAKIGLVDFKNKESLKQKGHSLFTTKKTPDSFEGNIVQGALETSNVIPIEQLSQMIKIQNHLTSTQKLLEEKEKAEKRTVNSSAKNV